MAKEFENVIDVWLSVNENVIELHSLFKHQSQLFSTVPVYVSYFQQYTRIYRLNGGYSCLFNIQLNPQIIYFNLIQ